MSMVQRHRRRSGLAQPEIEPAEVQAEHREPAGEWAAGQQPERSSVVPQVGSASEAVVQQRISQRPSVRAGSRSPAAGQQRQQQGSRRSERSAPTAKAMTLPTSGSSACRRGWAKTVSPGCREGSAPLALRVRRVPERQVLRRMARRHLCLALEGWVSRVVRYRRRCHPQRQVGSPVPAAELEPAYQSSEYRPDCRREEYLRVLAAKGCRAFRAVVRRRDSQLGEWEHLQVRVAHQDRTDLVRP